MPHLVVNDLAVAAAVALARPILNSIALARVHQVAKGGLDYMYDHFEFIRDGKKYVLREALEAMKLTF